MSDNLPYVVYGTIKDSTETAINGAKVVLRNDRTGKKISTTTDSAGAYALDAANIQYGYSTTDRLSTISAWGDEEAASSVLISDSSGSVNVDLTLATQAESSDVTYCQVQDVLDELDGKTTSDISYERVRKSILRAESEIDERTESSFKPVVITDEIRDFNQYTSYKSPEQLIGRNTNLLVGNRSDYRFSTFNDEIRLVNRPLVVPATRLNGVTTTTATELTVDSTANFPSSGTIFIYNSTNGTEAITYGSKTSTKFKDCTRATNGTTASAHADNSYVNMLRVSKNTGDLTGTDSWTDIQPQNGAGGDFVWDGSTAFVTFIQSVPALGKRKVKASYTYGRLTVPKVVENLCILLSVKYILTSKSSGSGFYGADSISLEGVSVTPSFSQGASYLKELDRQIESLWKSVGELYSDTI